MTIKISANVRGQTQHQLLNQILATAIDEASDIDAEITIEWPGSTDKDRSTLATMVTKMFNVTSRMVCSCTVKSAADEGDEEELLGALKDLPHEEALAVLGTQEAERR